jgi:hypothetical protein
MQNNEIYINWNDAIHYLWNRKLVIFLFALAGLLLGLYNTKNITTLYEVKIPYTSEYSWITYDVIKFTDGKWRVSGVRNKPLKDSGIKGYFIHMTTNPGKMNLYLSELSTLSNKLAEKQYTTFLEQRKNIYSNYPKHVQASNGVSNMLHNIEDFIFLYENNRLVMFEAINPNTVASMSSNIGITKIKSRKKITIALFIFLSIALIIFILLTKYALSKR